ncbi:hypothetical protein MGSAQ_001133 [marine sediment metagenome]|uniref:Uncharacterized protein n=1 Tax=marine sediment metagenome TaxID=412755 RepID=A0A1B6NV84_9ZZZZ
MPRWSKPLCCDAHLLGFGSARYVRLYLCYSCCCIFVHFIVNETRLSVPTAN